MGFLSNLFGGIGNALGGAVNSIGGGLSHLFGGGGFNPMSMFGGQQSGQQNMMNFMGGPNQYMGGMSPSNPNIYQNRGGGGGGGMFGGMNMGNLGMGAGIMGLGQLFGGKAKAPNLNTPQFQDYQNFVHNPPQLPQGMQDELNKSIGIQQEQESRNLRDVYKNLRPGSDITNDSAYARDLGNLQRNQASNRANAMMQPTLQYQYPLQQALGQQAEYGAMQPILEAGMKAQQVQQTKDLFGNVGNMFMMRGLFPNMFNGFQGGNGYNNA